MDSKMSTTISDEEVQKFVKFLESLIAAVNKKYVKKMRYSCGL